MAVRTGRTGPKAEAGHTGPHPRLTCPSFGLKALDEILSRGLTFEAIGVPIEALSNQKIAAKNVEYLSHLLISKPGLCGLEIGKSVIAPNNLASERCQSC